MGSRTPPRAPDGGRSGDSIIGVYEAVASSYGWTFRQIEDGLTDEQLAGIVTARAERLAAENFRELDRTVVGTSWGVGIAFDSKRRNVHKWARIRRAEDRRMTGRSAALNSDALEGAIAGLAATHPEYVVIGGAA